MTIAAGWCRRILCPHRGAAVEPQSGLALALGDKSRGDRDHHRLLRRVCYLSITGLIGWPSEARVPEHFQLHWATVVEPDKLNGLPGSIYLWIEALDEKNMLAGMPRAYRVPYSRELADRIGRAKERIEQGADQIGTARDLDDAGGRARRGSPARRCAAGSRSEPGSTGDPAAFIQHMPSIEFEDMPPPALPPKQPL